MKDLHTIKMNRNMQYFNAKKANLPARVHDSSRPGKNSNFSTVRLTVSGNFLVIYVRG